jgi:hypothetical protein
MLGETNKFNSFSTFQLKRDPMASIRAREQSIGRRTFKRGLYSKFSSINSLSQRDINSSTLEDRRNINDVSFRTTNGNSLLFQNNYLANRGIHPFVSFTDSIKKEIKNNSLIPDHAFLAIFDGNNGNYIAEELKRSLHSEFLGHLILEREKMFDRHRSAENDIRIICKSLLEACYSIDKFCLISEFRKFRLETATPHHQDIQFAGKYYTAICYYSYSFSCYQKTYHIYIIKGVLH